MVGGLDVDVDVLLYGATGYTGRLVARELDALGARFAVAGRDARKVEALAASLPSRPPAVALALDDGAQMRAAASRARVLLSAAGPYRTLGPPALDAALAAGAHFADITGEQSFLRHSLSRDAEARERGVTVVNALGFDVVPSDLAAIVAAEPLDAVDALDIVIASRSGATRGTRRSGAASAGAGWWFDDGRFRRAPPGRFVRDARFPDPLGTRRAAFIPWGDVVTAPRSTGARSVRTFFTMRPQRARALHLAWPVSAVAERLPWTRRGLEAKASAAPEGPSEEERARASFTILAEATAPDGRVSRGIVEGRDPYGLTGASAALAAVKLARGDARGVGVLTPSQAFDLRDHAKALSARFGLAWRREPGESGRGG